MPIEYAYDIEVRKQREFFWITELKTKYPLELPFYPIIDTK